MTKEQFMNGVPFKVASKVDYKGASTFKYDECIMKQVRSGEDNSILLEDYHLNVKKIGRLGFEGFVFVMNKKVNIKYKFEDLIVFL
jgi:hypothetical protein